MFPSELEQDAFRANNGEFGWTRAQIPLVVEFLKAQGLGILGGELWWVRDGISGWVGLIPQRQGSTAVYHWETDRHNDETWPTFVERSVSDTLAAVEQFPGPDELPPDLPGRILYNLVWVSQTEFEEPDNSGPNLR